MEFFCQFSLRSSKQSPRGFLDLNAYLKETNIEFYDNLFMFDLSELFGLRTFLNFWTLKLPYPYQNVGKFFWIPNHSNWFGTHWFNRKRRTNFFRDKTKIQIDFKSTHSQFKSKPCWFLLRLFPYDLQRVEFSKCAFCH